MQKLTIINRDGDNFFVECPNCHSTDLNGQRILSCRSCHTHFQPYYEDGCTTFNVETDHGTISANDVISVIGLKGKDDYFKKILHGRNDYEEKLNKLKEKYPNLKVIRIYRDLQKNGKDSHGHERYRRFALIPLD
jgi:nitrate/TMAO reductase-like tetraheme cytochrome c subunit